MQILICAVGRIKAGPEKALFDHYSKRITWPLEVCEVAARRKLSGEELRRHEAELLSERIPTGAALVVLDERGREHDSRAFADTLGRWRDEGTRQSAFVIGGADGVDPALRQRADLVISLGRMTWPHMLVRGLLAEQIYRAQCILSGHPYHRD